MEILKYQKQKNGNYRVYIDKMKIDLNEEVILKYKLLYKNEITKQELAEIEAENKKYDIKDKALKFISKKVCSKKELERYLKKYGYDKKELVETILYFENNGLINDKKYLEAFVNDKISFTSDGPLKILRELVNAGIEESIASEYLNDYYEAFIEKMNKIILKKLKSNTKYGINYLIPQLKQLLNSYGYNDEMTAEALQELVIDSNSIILKEYQKLYDKYCKKYQGKQLEIFIKNKLRLKGFTDDDFLNLE